MTGCKPGLILGYYQLITYFTFVPFVLRHEKIMGRVKLLRIKQIEHNSGSTLISEGVDANYADIINYAIFALIKLKDQ